MISILKICGLLGIMVMAVSAKPIMEEDMDTTISSDDTTIMAPTNEIVNAENDDQILNTAIADVEVTTSQSIAFTTESTSNTETTAISMETMSTKSTAFDVESIPANDITPAIAEVEDLLDKTTSSPSVDSSNNTPTTTNAVPDTTIFNSATSDDDGSAITITGDLTMSTINDKGIEMAMTASSTMSAILVSSEAVTLEVSTMTPFLTSVQMNDLNNITEVKMDDFSEATSAKVDTSKVTDSQEVSMFPVTAAEGTTAKIVNLPMDAIPTSLNENSVHESHNEIDNVLVSSSSNEDTTRIESLSSLPPHLQESKNDENEKRDEKAKGNSNSIVVSFVALFSMALLHVIY